MCTLLQTAAVYTIYTVGIYSIVSIVILMMLSIYLSVYKYNPTSGNDLILFGFYFVLPFIMLVLLIVTIIELPIFWIRALFGKLCNMLRGKKR